MATLAELLREGDKNAVVSDIYRNVLGREIDPTGYAWAENLNKDEPSSAISLARRIAQSEEGKAYAKGNQEQYNYLAGLSQADNPYSDPTYSSMEYLGGGQFKDAGGGIINVDEAGQPISYNPSVSWYDQQLAKNPSALRATDYRNQVYLAGGPLDQTYNFNGKEVPIAATEYQVDPKTGKFVTDQNGNYKPVEFRPKGYNMWDDWAAPVAVVAIPALMAGGAYAAGAYGAGTGAGVGAAEGIGAGTAGDVFAGYSATGSAAGTAGSTVPAGYGALGAGTTAGGAMGPTYAEMGYTGLGEGMAGPTYGEMGYTGLNQAEAIAQADAAAKAAGGLTSMQKAQLLRMGVNSLGQMTGKAGSGGTGYSGGGTSGMTAYQRQSPFLSTAQQNVVPDSTEALTRLLRSQNG